MGGKAVAAVFGSTGATGRELVRELAHSKDIGRVNAITRRKIEANSEEWHAAFPGFHKGGDGDEYRRKVVVKVVDYEDLDGTLGDALKDVSVALCCLGTTHKDAGGREGFTKVDFEYVQAAAIACKAAQVGHFALLTSSGTSLGGKIPRWMSNYLWTKAKAEKAVDDLGFTSTSMWRPGLLERGEFTRSTEKIAKWFGAKGLSCADLGKAMSLYAGKVVKGQAKEGRNTIEGEAIREFLKGNAP